MVAIKDSKSDELSKSLDMRDGTLYYDKDGLGVLRAPKFTTVERDALTTMEEGDVIYNVTSTKYNFYNGAAWQEFTSS